MMTLNTLSGLKAGTSAQIQSINIEGSLRRRLMDLGLVEGSTVTCVGESPSGDPKAYIICGAAVALRNIDSAKINILQRSICQ